jgi:hypothetical protein
VTYLDSSPAQSAQSTQSADATRTTSSASSTMLSSKTTATSSVSASSYSSTSSPSPSSSAGPGGVSVECPSTNGTYFAVPNSTQRFQRFCNSDFNGNDGSVDIEKFVVSSFTECINKCIANNQLGGSVTTCQGVSWRWQGLPGTDYNFCYLKSKIGTMINFLDVESAILVT